MPVEVHGTAGSAPCRILYMTCDAVGVEYKRVEVDLMSGGTRTPEYLKMNPMHNIPTLKDGDFCLNESRAAAAYLAETYGKDDKLYPKDAKAKAVVNQRLFFDMGTFYKAAGDIMYPLMFGSGTPGDKEHDRFKEVMGWVNDFVKPTGYVAGTDHYTLADIAFAASYSTAEATGYFDLEPYPEAQAWFEKIKGELPNYEEANGFGAKAFGAWFKSKVKN